MKTLTAKTLKAAAEGNYAAKDAVANAKQDELNRFPFVVTFEGVRYYQDGTLGNRIKDGARQARYEADNGDRCWVDLKGVIKAD